MDRTEESRCGLDPRWGLLGFLFYDAHATVLVLVDRSAGILWSCHLASLLVGAGIVFSRPRLVGVATCWLVLGLPMWFAAVFAGLTFYPTSTLTHLGALVLALASLRRTGMPRCSSWRAAAALCVVWLLARIATPGNENVNLAFHFWFGWEGRYVSFPVYVAIMLSISTAVFVATEAAVRRWLSVRS